ncbi:unnamed protein product [Pelagomonas calceolata]|uniref:BspA family leucine-rich repeat surface protein n=1 Tax=Pelagomonas calceolata TaxID=35677 RepID=A0A8J2WXG2_9STRA|nr:unnamed protein product [Pelagomonas calceolata]
MARSATRCLARRARVVGALLASTASLAAAGPAKASRRKLTRYVMDDSTIRTAVAAWFADRSGAETTYGHISTWATGGVTDMSWLFCGRQDWMEGDSWWDDCVSAASFNEDIGAWDTSGVTTMEYMFYYASAFNQDIGGWAVHSVESMTFMFLYATAFDQDLGGWAVDSVTDMSSMFYGASSFDQDLGWCVNDGVDLNWAFSETQCESTSCGVLHTAALSCGGKPMGDATIRTAVDLWLSDSAAAEATYGHISTWETSGVTDMSYLFCGVSPGLGWSNCNTAAESFNEDIGAWDISGVTTMVAMFGHASAFNQDISGWAVDSVTDVSSMFFSAHAFDQDLGWCVDDDVSLGLPGAFFETQCESTYCGVKWETNTGDCDVSRTGNVMVNWKIRWAVSAWLADATAAEATYGHISTWETSGVTDMSYLFDVYYNSGAASFNEDIGAWGTSSVTTMQYTFYGAETFNQDLGGWAVDSVTDMSGMFYGASSFNQDLGWCVDDDVYINLFTTFSGTQCESTSCGVKQVAGGCAPSPAPTSPDPVVDAARLAGASAALLALALI